MDLMTSPEQEFPPVDPGNHLLSVCPAVLTTVPVMAQDGMRLAVTIRTNSATLTVLLAQLEVGAWAAQLARDEARMGVCESSLLVRPA